MEAGTALDMSRISTEFTVQMQGLQVDVARFFAQRVVHDVRRQMDDGVWRRSDSFGVVVCIGQPRILQLNWDNPYDLARFMVPFGPQGRRYCANGLRKCRASARALMSTLGISKRDDIGFMNIVESEVDGQLPWGDFPHPGATFVQDFDLGSQLPDGAVILIGTSGLTGPEDHVASSNYGMELALWLSRGQIPTDHEG